MREREREREREMLLGVLRDVARAPTDAVDNADVDVDVDTLFGCNVPTREVVLSRVAAAVAQTF